jgi:hypothetical protein
MNSQKGFWTLALSVAGFGAIGAFVFFMLYRQWLTLPIFDKLSQEQTYAIMKLFLVLVFLALTLTAILWFLTRTRQERENNSDGFKNLKSVDSCDILPLNSNLHSKQIEEEFKRREKIFEAQIPALTKALEIIARARYALKKMDGISVFKKPELEKQLREKIKNEAWELEHIIVSNRILFPPHIFGSIHSARRALEGYLIDGHDDQSHELFTEPCDREDFEKCHRETLSNIDCLYQKLTEDIQRHIGVIEKNGQSDGDGMIRRPR